MRLIYNPAKGWFATFTMRTGAVDFSTGRQIPIYVGGIALPEWLKYKFGPYPTADQAALAI